jgi:hypothetical protein
VIRLGGRAVPVHEHPVLGVGNRAAVHQKAHVLQIFQVGGYQRVAACAERRRLEVNLLQQVFARLNHLAAFARVFDIVPLRVFKMQV